MFHLLDSYQAVNWLLFKLAHIPMGMSYLIIIVYMPNKYLGKIQCWKSLLDLANGDPLQNFIIAGDFNITRLLN